MKQFAHLAIAASAGSGKTYKLAHRVLALLAYGVDPDKIGAFTFSRKAAGEIFDSVIEYLVEAAGDDAIASRTAQAIEKPDHRKEDFLQDLKRLMEFAHRFQVGTLDSRISRMLQSCAIELGLPPDLTMLDDSGSEASRVRLEVLDTLLHPERAKPETIDRFLNAFELTTFGHEAKGFDKQILEYLQLHRSLYLKQPEGDAWIHPGSRLLTEIPRELGQEERISLGESLTNAALHIHDARTRKAVVGLIEKAARYDQGSASKDMPKSALLDQIIESETLTYYGKETVLKSDVHDDLRLLLLHPAAVELHRSCAITLGVHQILQAFEDRYRDESLSRGMLTFDDATMLMSTSLPIEPSALAFRLDGQIDHWLLDEFQDTSDLQWRALKPFIEEVLQDSEGRRSHFYVGDVKQAIYGWRGGNADLFEQIREEWGISEQPMNASWRSAKPVLDFVNHLLLHVTHEDEFPVAAIDQWNHQYGEHVAAKTDLEGFTRLVQIDKGEIEKAVADTLRELDPIARGLDVAILVRSNKGGVKLAEALRAEVPGIPIVLEGNTPLRSDLAVEAVRAWLRLAAHPDDRMSARIVQMSPLRETVHKPVHILTGLQEQGISKRIRDLCGAFGELPDYSVRKLNQLVDAALEYEQNHDPDIDGFLDFLDLHMLREEKAERAVRIMTIHQSKGLGFDAVLLPELDTDFKKTLSNEFVTAASEGGEPPDWIFRLPVSAACTHIPALEPELQRLSAEKCYEGFCTLYVALTRAKQGLYLFVPPPPKSGKGSMNKMHNWISSRTPIDGETGTYQNGNPDWADSFRPKPVATEAEASALSPAQSEKPLDRFEPSGADTRAVNIGDLFKQLSTDGRALGTIVHDALEHLDWTDQTDPAAWMQRSGVEDAEAIQHLKSAFTFKVLQRPDGVVDLWQERGFEIALERGWVTGTFDRVVIFQDRAWIQDYKTNRIESEDDLEKAIEHYRPQMDLYREVLSEILGMPQAAITCQLLFTGTGEVHVV